MIRLTKEEFLSKLKENHYWKDTKKVGDFQYESTVYSDTTDEVLFYTTKPNEMGELQSEYFIKENK